MTFPDWRQRLVRSIHLHRSKAEAKYFQVASVNRDNQAQNRTMVFRGFLDDTNYLLAVSDLRSQKVSEWLSNGHSQICWYFAKSREQFRISANVRLILSEEGKQSLLGERSTFNNNNALFDVNQSIHQKIWTSLSNAAKQQFYWPEPKQDYDQETKNVFADSSNVSLNNNETMKDIPNTFVVVCFEPLNVDYLDLKTNPQTRLLQTFDLDTKSWKSRAVNP